LLDQNHVRQKTQTRKEKGMKNGKGTRKNDFSRPLFRESYHFTVRKHSFYNVIR